MYCYAKRFVTVIVYTYVRVNTRLENVPPLDRRRKIIIIVVYYRRDYYYDRYCDLYRRRYHDKQYFWQKKIFILNGNRVMVTECNTRLKTNKSGFEGK